MSFLGQKEYFISLTHSVINDWIQQKLKTYLCKCEIQRTSKWNCWIAHACTSCRLTGFTISSSDQVNCVFSLFDVSVRPNVVAEVTGSSHLRTKWFERCAWSVESALVVALKGTVWVFENSLGSLLRLKCFWLGKSGVKHQLVVFDETHLSLELFIMGVLTLREDIHSLIQGSSVTVSTFTKSVITLVILSKIGVEGSLSVCWQILCPQTTRHIWNVGISSTSIVHVNHWLGVDVSQVVLCPLLVEVKST